MYKKCKVIMLPANTENDGSIILFKNTKILILSFNNTFRSELTDKEEIRHDLYITSDDEIKEGDWFLNQFTKSIVKNYNLEKDGNIVKIIATTDPSLNLPKIPEAFIKEYIKEYDENNSIIDVDIKYNNNIYPITEERIQYIKTNSNNEVSIKPIKESWSREEVESLCRKAISEHCGLSISDQPYNSKESIEMQNNWIDKNL